MKIERPCRYWESYLPTPRHRNLRWREIKGTVTADIREVTSAEAPVAIVRTTPFHRLGLHERGRGTKHRLEYHWFEGRFYTTIRRSMFCCYYGDDIKNKGMKPARVQDIHWQYIGIIVAPFESRQKHFTEAMSRYLIIDGKLCAEIGEPRYVVMTFGLGSNHGGTALMLDHNYNPNIVTEAYFRADEEAEAREAAMSVAAGRGDTKDVPRIRRRMYDRFQILIPEAVTMERDQRLGEVDAFSAKATEITNSGMPPMLGALALFAEVFR